MLPKKIFPCNWTALSLADQKFLAICKKIVKSNLDKVVKRRTYKQIPLGLEDPYVVYGIYLCKTKRILNIDEIMKLFQYNQPQTHIFHTDRLKN